MLSVGDRIERPEWFQGVAQERWWRPDIWTVKERCKKMVSTLPSTKGGRELPRKVAKTRARGFGLLGLPLKPGKMFRDLPSGG